ncbi:pectate lyase-like [Andrographis paniculata]|uniref:pectate lyase-like n=1 Tax=Andrographis paniculata TaxID=175694 RepID=UPI0021E83014|nr:pectate lyase-like [Andrographis paniculata]
MRLLLFALRSQAGSVPSASRRHGRHPSISSLALFPLIPHFGDPSFMKEELESAERNKDQLIPKMGITTTNQPHYLIAFLLFFSVLLSATADVVTNATLEEKYRKAAAEAYEDSMKAYNPNPLGVADDFTSLVKKSLKHKNSSRRHLEEDEDDGCMATNPIDRCWRCDPNWAKNRKRLAECARGFGHETTGGKEGRYYVVSDPSDDVMDNPLPGTLRHAVIQTEPLWIIFEHSMVIQLKQELMMTSDKTIDGRGKQVHIAYGAGITIQFVHNVIIHNIWIHNIIPKSGGMIRDALAHIGLRTRSDGDAISVYGSSRVWIDHVSLSKGTDGLIDVIEGSTAVTISNCKFNNHNDVMLLGAHDDSEKDSIMQVTVAFNRFGKGLIQRMPRVRWGFAHVVNNDYSHWELYAIGGSSHPTIISQGNRFRASNNPYTKQVTKRDYASESEWRNWQWRSEGDMFKNGAYFLESGPPLVHENSQLTAENMVKFKPGSYAGRLTRSAGALKCRPGKYC